jgi:hypothetical protein
MCATRRSGSSHQTNLRRGPVSGSIRARANQSQYAYYVDKDNPEFMALWNHLENIHKVSTSADTAVQSANSNTSYSWMGLDLRVEPMVISLLARIGGKSDRDGPSVRPQRSFDSKRATWECEPLGTRSRSLSSSRSSAVRSIPGTRPTGSEGMPTSRGRSFLRHSGTRLWTRGNAH